MLENLIIHSHRPVFIRIRSGSLPTMVVTGSHSRNVNDDAVSDSLQVHFNHGFGVQNIEGRDNVILVDTKSDTVAVIIPVGRRVALVEDGSTHFVSLCEDFQQVTALAVSKDNAFLAVCAKGKSVAIGPLVTVHKLKSRKASPKTLKTTLVSSNYTTAVFLDDSKRLAVASKDSVEIWQWEREKMQHSFSISDVQISRLRCPPPSTVQQLPLLTSSGKGHMRMWITTSGERISNRTMMSAVSKEQSMDFVDHTWLSEEGNVAAIVTSEESSNSSSSVIIFQFASSKVEEADLLPIIVIEADTRMYCISPLTTGFAVGGSGGFVGIFLPLKGTVENGAPNLTFSQIQAFTHPEDDIKCIYPSKLQILLYSKKKRVYSCSESDLAKSSFVEFFPGGFHNGRIIDADLAASQPLCITAAMDKSVKIWDLEARRCIATKLHDDTPRAASIHPSGYQALICFSDRVVMYHVVNHDMAQIFEIQGKDCRKVRFSYGGHYFAVAFGRKISVFETYKQLANSQSPSLHVFNYHTAQITAMEWNPSDNSLYTSAMDGNIYAWDLKTGSRIEEFVIRGPSLSNILDFSVICDVNDCGNYCAVVCFDDGNISMMTCRGSNPDIMRLDYNKSNSEKARSICLDSQSNVLLVGMDDGSILVYDWPLAKDGSALKRLLVHSYGSVECMCSTGDGGVLSGGDDGAVFLTSIVRSEMGKIPRWECRSEGNSNVVLVCRDELNRMTEDIDELNKSIDKIRRDNEYAHHSKDASWREERNQLQNELCELRKESEKKCSDLEARHSESLRHHAVEYGALKLRHDQLVTDLENEYEDRLLEAANQISLRQSECAKLKEQHEQDLIRVNAAHRARIEEQSADNFNVVSKLQSEIKDLHEELDRSEQTRNEMLSQQEEEYESELSYQCLESIKRLKMRQRTIDEVNIQVQTLGSKREQLILQNKDLKGKVAHHQHMCVEESKRCRTLEDEIQRLKVKLEEKNDSLSKANALVLGMRLEKLSLEKELYLMTSAKEELEKERTPLEQTLLHQKNLEEGLLKSLSESQLVIENLRSQIEVLTLKIKTKDYEMRTMRSTINDRGRKLQVMEGVLNELANISDEKEVLRNVKIAYRKYVKGEIISPTRSRALSHDNKKVNTECPKSEMPNADVERNANDFEKRLKKEMKAIKLSLSKRMGENTILMQECDDLRKENFELKTEVARMQTNYGSTLYP